LDRMSIFSRKATIISSPALLGCPSFSRKASGDCCFGFNYLATCRRSAQLHRSCSGLSRLPLSQSTIRLDPRPILEKDPMADESPLKLLLPPSLRL
jgi:hypothetical protein